MERWPRRRSFLCGGLTAEFDVSRRFALAGTLTEKYTQIMMMNRAIFLAAAVLFGGIAFGQSYSITGEVRRPGTYSLPKGSTSVLQAIALAEGLTKSANPADAVIVRGDRQIPINVKDVLSGRIKDFPLVDGDELRIPKRKDPGYPPGYPLPPPVNRLDAELAGGCHSKVKMSTEPAACPRRSLV
jgi:hypothetical protein